MLRTTSLVTSIHRITTDSESSTSKNELTLTDSCVVVCSLVFMIEWVGSFHDAFTHPTNRTVPLGPRRHFLRLWQSSTDSETRPMISISCVDVPSNTSRSIKPCLPIIMFPVSFLVVLHHYISYLNDFIISLLNVYRSWRTSFNKPSSIYSCLVDFHSTKALWTSSLIFQGISDLISLDCMNIVTLVQCVLVK